MAMKQPRPTYQSWICSALVGLLLVLTSGTSALPSSPSEAAMQVAIYEGEISVDLKAAQIREVLAVIGQQANLRIYIDEATNGTVHAQFRGIALDEGLRRLLHAASLSYTLLYARGSAEAAILQEVRVFGVTHGEPTPHREKPRLGREQRTAGQIAAMPPEESEEPEPSELDEEIEPDIAEPEPEIDAEQN